MSVTYFCVDPKAIIVPQGHSERDEGFIFNHLKAYCALFDPLPAITVAFRDSSIVLLRGHIYLKIARELGRSSIRASAFGVAEMSMAGVQAVIPAAELEQEQAQTIVDGWHVFFLPEGTSTEDAFALRNHFLDFLCTSLPKRANGSCSPAVEWKCDRQSGLFAMKFLTPVADQEWADNYRRQFDCLPRGLRFVSYQGRRLPTPDHPHP